MKTIDILWKRRAEKFLAHNAHLILKAEANQIVLSAVKKLLGDQTINVDLSYLKGRSKGAYRIRTRNIRIIFSLTKGEVYTATIEDIDFRGNVYKLREPETLYSVKDPPSIWP